MSAVNAPDLQDSGVATVSTLGQLSDPLPWTVNQALGTYCFCSLGCNYTGVVNGAEEACRPWIGQLEARQRPQPVVSRNVGPESQTLASESCMGGYSLEVGVKPLHGVWPSLCPLPREAGELISFPFFQDKVTLRQMALTHVSWQLPPSLAHHLRLLKASFFLLASLH